MTFAAMTLRVLTGTIFTALFARCRAFAIATAILRPVKLPGPMERYTWLMSAGVLANFWRSDFAVGIISALWESGAEKFRDSSSLVPDARATEPFLPEVSSARISGWGILGEFAVLGWAADLGSRLVFSGLSVVKCVLLLIFFSVFYRFSLIGLKKG